MAEPSKKTLLKDSTNRNFRSELMNFQSIPENYSPINEPLNYVVEFAEKRDVVDVKILDLRRERVLGLKRLYDVTEAQIDIAPYVKRALDFRPAACGTELLDADGLYALVAIEIDGQRSPERCYAPYDICDELGTLFRAGGKHSQLSIGESDYVVIYAPHGGTVRIESYLGERLLSARELPLEAKQELRMLKILPDDFAPEGSTVLLAFEIDGIVDFLSYRVAPKPEQSKRLLWVGQDGVLQSYTFPNTIESTHRVTRQVVESGEGEVVTSCQREHLLKIVSDYETVDEIKRIGEILGARKAWIDRGVEAERVDVVSTEMVVKYGGALNSMQVELRLHQQRKEVA